MGATSLPCCAGMGSGFSGAKIVHTLGSENARRLRDGFVFRIMKQETMNNEYNKNQCLFCPYFASQSSAAGL